MSPTSAVTPVSIPATTLFSQNFEADTGLAGWSIRTFAVGGSTADWRGVEACQGHAGAKIFRFGGTTCTADYGSNDFSFAQPNGAAGISVPPGPPAPA